MNTAKLFANGGSQAVRLPKEFQFAGEEVCISKIGDVVMLFPKEKGWDLLESSVGQVSDDFMTQRDQGIESQTRPSL